MEEDVVDEVIDLLHAAPGPLAEAVARVVVPEHQEAAGLAQVRGQLVVPLKVLAEAVGEEHQALEGTKSFLFTAGLPMNGPENNPLLSESLAPYWYPL